MITNWGKAARLLPILMGAVTTSVQAEVLITEYVEGGGNNKAIEISNIGSESVSLEGYILNLYDGSDGTKTKATYEYSGTLEAGASFAIYNSGSFTTFTEQFGSAANVVAAPSATIVQHNGNDSFTLTKNGVVVDSIGTVGDSANFAKDKTLRRKATITTGDTNSTDAWSEADWFSAGKDVGDGLGCPGIEACATGPVEPVDGPNVLITEIVNGTASNKVIEISNIGNKDIDLATEYYQIQMYRDGATWPSEQVWLQGNLKAGSSIVISNSDAGVTFKKEAPQGLDAADVATFNGNDAIVLLKGLGKGTVVDSFGQVGSNLDIISATATLRRKTSATVGNTNITDNFSGDQATEWDEIAQDTVDGLGCSGEAACVGGESLPEAGTPVKMGICYNCEALDVHTNLADYNHDNYYATTLAADQTDKTAFRAALTQDITLGVKQLTYKEVWTALTFADQDPNDSDNVVLLYTGRSVFKNQNGSGDQANIDEFWNREHVWPQARGFTSESQPGHTDIHHLRATQYSINNKRGNLDFAAGGTLVGDTENKSSTDSWEPRDAVKGDVARIALYMDVRYEVGEANMPDLVLVDDVKNTSDNSVSQMGKLCDLLAWHAQDPVDEIERARNNTVYEYQGNRNPFIDHPEWASVAFKDACPVLIDSITFETQSDVELTTQITSETQTLTGFFEAQDISITGGEYSIGCTDTFVSTTGKVEPNDTICLRHTSSSKYETEVKTSVKIGGSTFFFSSITLKDPFPVVAINPITFGTKENQERSTLIVSDSETLSGFDTPQNISVINGEYSIGCTDTFTSESNKVNSGDSLCLRHTTAPGYSGKTMTIVTIGASTFGFSSVTLADPQPNNQTPEPFGFAPIKDTPRFTDIQSGIVVISGLGENIQVDISVTGGSYSIGCNGGFTSKNGKVSQGDRICVKHTSSADFEETTTTTLVVAGVKATFVSTTNSKKEEQEETKGRTVKDDDDDKDTVIGSINGSLLMMLALLIFARRRNLMKG